MLFTADSWPGIADGTITVTFRTWTRPQAKVGGRYRVGGMSIEATAVAQVPAGSITDADARAAGAADRASVVHRLGSPADDALVWRVDFRCVGVDDRIERRNRTDVTPDELAAIRARLDRMDRSGAGVPWTRQVLRLIERYPGVVSTALARQMQLDRPVFKVQVRKLKELGLTESLDVGYRLSPLGEALLRSLG